MGEERRVSGAAPRNTDGMEKLAHFLAPWSNFYVVMGSSAAALTGLVFVVITLITSGRVSVTREGVAGFTTPTIVHFSSALFISLMMNVPWSSRLPLRVILAMLGAAGLLYSIRLAVMNSRLEIYRMEADDWVYHVALPAFGFALIFSGALGLETKIVWSTFAIACGCIAFIFLGIRNAWDVVTYLAIEYSAAQNEPASDHTGAGET